MAANILGLFFLIIGTAGISNVFSLKEINHRNKRSFPPWDHDPFDVRKYFRERSEALCRYNYGPLGYKNILCDPPNFKIDMNHNGKNYPKWQYPNFRYGFVRDWHFDNPSNEIDYDQYVSSEENVNKLDDTNQRHAKSEKSFFDYIRALSSLSDNPTKSYAFSKSSTPSTLSDGVNFATNLYESFKKLSNDEFLPESNKVSRLTETSSNPEVSRITHKTPAERLQKSSFFMEKENADLMIEGKIMFTTLENSSEGSTLETTVNHKGIGNSNSKFLKNIFTKSEATARSFIGNSENRIDGLNFAKSNPITSYPSTLEVKRESGGEFSLKKISSLEEHLNESNEQNQTESTLIQESSSIITKEVEISGSKLSTSDNIETTNDSKMLPNFENEDPSSLTTEVVSLENKISLSDDIQPTSKKEFKLETTDSQSTSSLTIDEENSVKTESHSSEGIFSASTQTLETESDTSPSSFTITYDSTTASQFKLSSSDETQSTTDDILKLESTTDDILKLESTTDDILKLESTTDDILKLESTTENFISSSKMSSIPFTDRVKEDSTKEIFSTESPSSKIHFTPKAITEDHIIEIPSIRKARIVVTSIFLVIALIAFTVLAVFLFRLRRKEVQYDQLMLIR